MKGKRNGNGEIEFYCELVTGGDNGQEGTVIKVYDIMIVGKQRSNVYHVKGCFN